MVQRRMTEKYFSFPQEKIKNAEILSQLKIDPDTKFVVQMFVKIRINSLQGLHPQRGKIKVGRLVLQLVLVLPFLLGHVFNMQDCSSLWVVETGRSVEHSHKEQSG